MCTKEAEKLIEKHQLACSENMIIAVNKHVKDRVLPLSCSQEKMGNKINQIEKKVNEMHAFFVPLKQTGESAQRVGKIIKYILIGLTLAGTTWLTIKQVFKP